MVISENEEVYTHPQSIRIGTGGGRIRAQQPHITSRLYVRQALRRSIPPPEPARALVQAAPLRGQRRGDGGGSPRHRQARARRRRAAAVRCSGAKEKKYRVVGSEPEGKKNAWGGCMGGTMAVGLTPPFHWKPLHNTMSCCPRAACCAGKRHTSKMHANVHIFSSSGPDQPKPPLRPPNALIPPLVVGWRSQASCDTPFLFLAPVPSVRRAAPSRERWEQQASSRVKRGKKGIGSRLAPASAWLAPSLLCISQPWAPAPPR